MTLTCFPFFPLPHTPLLATQVEQRISDSLDFLIIIFYCIFQRYDAIEVCQKCMFQMELTKPTKDGMFGFAVEAELAEDFDRDDELQVYVCEITAGGVAEKAGSSLSFMLVHV